MLTIKIVVGVISSYFLFVEYSKIRSGNFKSKVFHYLSTVFIVAMHSNCLRDFAILIFRFRITLAKALEGLSQFEGIINFVNNIVYSVLELIIMYIGIGLIYRSEDARKLIIRYSIYLVPVITIHVFMRARQEHSDNLLAFFVLGLISSVTIYGLISYLYRQKFMVDFFDKKNF